MPWREFLALIGTGAPRETTNTSTIHAARASTSTAVANVQLPGEAREEIGRCHGDLPGGARGRCTGIACTTWNHPSRQCGQFCHSMPATRRMNASTDSTTTGSGAGDLAREKRIF